MDFLLTYDFIYKLASYEGREEALFGDCAPLAREAFSRSIAGDEFPLVWFEIPLLGKPRFDLHVALSRKALSANANFLPGAGNGYKKLFAWYGREEPGGLGLAFAYDVSEGKIDSPAVHVNVNGVALSNMDEFFKLASGLQAAELYRGFTDQLPQGWRVWYTGVHPGRPGSPVRVDCFVDEIRKSAYVSDLRLFENDLRSCGFTAPLDSLGALAAPILSSPFGLELQFDVLNDGSVGPTLGISACFGSGSESHLRPMLQAEGDAGQLLAHIEEMGLADSRWQQLAGGIYTRTLPVEDSMMLVTCSPTFVKLRMRNGKPFDAKVYIQAFCSDLADATVG